MAPAREGASTSFGLSKRRGFWTMLDQVLVSIRNFGILLFIIRSGDGALVGSFGIVYTSYFLSMAVVRGLAGDPFVVRWSGSEVRDFKRGARASSGAVVLISGLIGLLFLGTPLLVSSQTGVGMALLGVALVPLLVQDHLRLVLFADRRPRAAAWNDLIVCATLAGTLVLATVADAPVLATAVIAWGGTAAIGAAVGVRQTAAAPRLGAAVRWVRENRDLGPVFAVDALANRGTEQLANVLVAALSGLASLGAVTASRTLFAPLTTVQTGVNAFLTPEIARAVRISAYDDIARQVSVVSALLGGLMLVTGGLLALVPSSLGEALFSGNWGSAIDLLLPMTVFSSLNAVAFGYWAALKALSVAKETLVVRLAGGFLMVLTASVGAAKAGAEGAAWGMAASAAMPAVLLGLLFYRQVSRARA